MKKLPAEMIDKRRIAMHIMKKIACVLLIAVLLLTSVSVAAAAASADKSLTVEVTTDKNSYGITDTVLVRVKVTNPGLKTAKNILVVPYAEKHMIVGKTDNVFGIAQLKAGESQEVSFRAALSRRAGGLSFFTRFVLFFNQLFKQFTPFEKKEYENKDYVSGLKTVTHGGVNDTFDVSVWYDAKLPLTDSEQIEQLGNINDAIARLTNASDYQNAEAKTREDKTEKLLMDYQDQGLVKNVTYNNDTGAFEFAYFNGFLGVVETRDPDPEINGVSKSGAEPLSFTPTKTNSLSADAANVGEALVLFSFNQSWDEPEFREPFYQTLKEDWDSQGLITDVDMNVTVKDIKTIPAKYDVVCFSGHGGTYDGEPFMALSEIVTNENMALYYDDLLNERLLITSGSSDKGSRYCVLSSLISSAYRSGDFSDTIIFSECCEFLGQYGSYNYAFADAFFAKGAQTVYGFHNSVYANYCRDSMQYWVNCMLAEDTALDAFEKTIREYGSDDEVWYRSKLGYSSGRDAKAYAVPKLLGNITARLIPQKDTVKPTGFIDSTNSVSSGQTVTLYLCDNFYVDGYYWGTSPNYSRNTYYTYSSTYQALFPSCETVSKTVSSAGTYYLTVKDTSGNLSDTVSITFYKTTLNANGGSVSPSAVLTPSGSSFAIPSARRSGYALLGWANSASASTASYQPGVSIRPSANSTLYAVWAIKGDVNTDGNLDLVDLVNLRMYVEGSTSFTEIQKDIADMNNDGSVDETDLNLLRAVLAAV